MLPNFLIIGSSKCWNNCITLLLKAASGVSFLRLKEPNTLALSIKIFLIKRVDISVDRYAIKSFNQYKKLFQQINNKRVGELVQMQFIFIKTADHILSTLGMY